MALDSLKQVIWSKKLLAAFERKTVFASLCNRDYEGDARLGGTVIINTVGTPVVSEYDPEVPITYDDLSATGQELVIDLADMFRFKAKDVDRAAQMANAVPKALQLAGAEMALAADEYIAGFYDQIAAGNIVNGGTALAILDGDDAYEALVALAQTMDETDVPEDGRWAVIPPWYQALLRKNTLFLQNAATGGQTLRNGQIGQVLGMDVLMSNGVPLITGDDYAVMAGVQDAITFANGIDEVETIRLQDDFADGNRGLHVYGGKITNSKGLALLKASKTAV